jgi:hypothetical protein
VFVHADDIKTHEKFFNFTKQFFLFKQDKLSVLQFKKVIIFESHHVKKKIAASPFKNAEKPPQIFHFL